MLSLPPTFVRPEYAGGAIVNLPPTIGRALGVEVGWKGPAIAGEGVMPADGPWDRVVLFLLDGLGWDRWSTSTAEVAPLVDRASALGGSARSLTSVAPSTTAVATTSVLGDGSAPLAHGLLGYTARLPSLGVIANLLFWRPEHGPGGAGSLESWGLPPETFVRQRSLFEVLGSGGVASRVFMPSQIAGSPLSRAQMRGPAVSGYVSLDDGLHGVWSWLEETRERAFAYLYVSDLDTLSHRDGPEGISGRITLASICTRLAATLDRLGSGRQRGRTLVLVTADHGHVATPPEEAWALDDAPEVGAMLSAPPGGEARHAYLYARSGAGQDLLQACIERFGEGFVALSGPDAVASGLYGPTQSVHTEASARIGDVVLLARGGATFWRTRPETFPKGMHGSLEPAEMQVPLLAFSV